nr:hypothetical protein BaRGS_033054 [Batillaria attramentaria]
MGTRVWGSALRWHRCLRGNGFLDKNKDTQQDSLFELMHSAMNKFVKDLTRFQPNSKKLPNDYQPEEVLQQLRYSGMLDIIRIKREGYPVHIPVETFLSKYGILLHHSASTDDPRSAAISILNELHLPVTEWQVGKTKVFMRNQVFEPLEERRQELMRQKAVTIQRIWRGFYCRREYLRKREAALILQESFRSFRLRLEYLRKRRAAIVLQTHLRGTLARRLASKLRIQKRQEEERRKQEEMERERKDREKEAADELAIEESLKKLDSAICDRQSQMELESLTHLIESMWTHHKPPVSPHSLDLDEMFDFLREEKAEQRKAEPEKVEALDAINQQFEQLDELWSRTEKVGMFERWQIFLNRNTE